MVWTTTSASHSFSHSGLWSSAPVAAGAASPSSCGLGSLSGVAPSGASSSFGAPPSPSCGAAAGASSSCGGAGASSSCAAAAAGAGASSSCAAAAGASAGAAASAGPLSSCGGAGGWAGGSRSLRLLLLWGWWLGRGHPHGLWVGAEVHNFIGLVRLPPRLPLVQLLIRFAFGGEHLAAGHELRPVVLFLLLLPLLAGAPLIVGDDDDHVVLRGRGACLLDFGSLHNHRRDGSGAVDDPPRLVAFLVGPISALHELISCLVVRVGSALLLGLGSRTGWGGTARTSLFLWLVWDWDRLLRCWL